MAVFGLSLDFVCSAFVTRHRAASGKWCRAQMLDPSKQGLQKYLNLPLLREDTQSTLVIFLCK